MRRHRGSMRATCTRVILFAPAMSRSSVATVILAWLSLATPLAAQRITASVSGTVTDDTGAVLPDVVITARNRATGFRRDTTTDTLGLFVIDNLPIEGPYE